MNEIPIGLSPRAFKAVEQLAKKALQHSQNHKEVRAAITAIAVLFQNESSEPNLEVFALRRILKHYGNQEFERPSQRLDPVYELSHGHKPPLDNDQHMAALKIKKVWSGFSHYLNVAAKDYNKSTGQRGHALDPISVMSDETAYLWRQVYSPWYERAKRKYIDRSGINEAEVTLAIVVEANFPQELDRRYRLKEGRSLTALQRQLTNFASLV